MLCPAGEPPGSQRKGMTDVSGYGARLAGFSPTEELPDYFLKPDGSRVSSPGEWEEQRVFLKRMLSDMMFGHLPPAPRRMEDEIVERGEWYAGAAYHETVRLTADGRLSLLVEVTRPKAAGKFPVFIWNQFAQMERCPVEEEACRLGYAIVSFDRTRLAPDEEGASAFDGGAFGCAYPESDARAVGIWGWGHSLVASWLIGMEWADSKALIAVGHSRGGKAAFWAAAYDERIAVCAASGSGCGGGGCFRWMGGRLGQGVGVSESLGDLTRKDRFWYWYADRLAQFGNRHGGGELLHEVQLPFDCHTLRALVAPRAVICVEGLDDTWSNGYGTQVGWRAGEEVYRFLGREGANALAFFEGGHEFTAPRWKAVLDFCETTLRGRPQKLQYRRFAPQEAPVPPLHYSWRAPGMPD